MALDVASFWDYGKPELSEQRFREALKEASDDEALVLQSQIARTYGLRKDFARAREVLASIEAQATNASPEARTRYFLELGRTYASTTHPPESQTPQTRELARSHYMRAFETAQQARLDALAVDALHMMVCVDSDPDQQLEWNMKAVAFMEASSQPEAKKWEGSLRNNVGYAQHLRGNYEEALRQYALSLAAHERAGRAANVRIAQWMIAHTLRAQGKFGEAIDIQLRLEREFELAGEPDPYVFEELEHLFRAVNDTERAESYAQKLRDSRTNG
jgi:tetratricopeptide (TPR) repeat protein